MAGYEIVGAKGIDIDPQELVRTLRTIDHGEVLVIDADVVCGREHLQSAVEHAERSINAGTNSCKDMAMETMLFVSGERQISKAQEKMSPKAGSQRFALVLFDANVTDVLELSWLVRDDSVLECTRAKAVSFGISKTELETAGEDKAQDLVLERVVFVEIAKR